MGRGTEQVPSRPRADPRPLLCGTGWLAWPVDGVHLALTPEPHSLALGETMAPNSLLVPAPNPAPSEITHLAPELVPEHCLKEQGSPGEQPECL